jgi:hypothetical protein
MREETVMSDQVVYTCSVCGGTFDAAAGYNDHGTFVCRQCFAAREALREGPTRRAPDYQIAKVASPSTGYRDC